MSLSKQVVKFIEKENIFSKTDHLLVAVSGGVDSMVLLHILHNQGYTISVAHVNYKLRDIDSDYDYELVRNYCSDHSISFHYYPLSTSEKLSLKRGNLQEKARRIRHLWFNTLMKDNDCRYLCTAHHCNDQIETFIFNSIRGSGLTGLTSMRAIKDDIRRPLFAQLKSKIIEYAWDNKVPFRQDQSNLESTYDRNFIRNEILEKLNERFPSCYKSLSQTSHILQDESDLLNYFIVTYKDRWLTIGEGYDRIGPLSELVSIPGHKSLLHHMLRPYEFNISDINDMILAIESSGSTFLSKSHEAVIHNDHMNIRPFQCQETATNNQIDGLGRWNIGSAQLTIRHVDTKEWTNDSNVELIDLDRINFPLEIRSCHEGDRFYPIGMGGRSKKLSDFFVDKKLNAFEKEKVKLLCQDSNIIWVIGHRLDDRYKVTESTKNVAELRWEINIIE